MALLTLGNSKLKKAQQLRGAMVATFSLPAQVTCPFAGECKKFCYAKKGNYCFKTVKAKHEANRIASLELDFVERINLELVTLRKQAAKKGLSLVIRLHDTGDFYNVDYTKKWAQIIEQNPDVEFYAYTKSWINVEKHIKAANWTMIPSEGGLLDSQLGNRPRAYVIRKGEEPKLNGTVVGNDDDLRNRDAIKAGWNVGLPIH
jgi:adenine-specific DNA glycosylase